MNYKDFIWLQDCSLCGYHIARHSTTLLPMNISGKIVSFTNSETKVIDLHNILIRKKLIKKLLTIQRNLI